MKNATDQIKMPVQLNWHFLWMTESSLNALELSHQRILEWIESPQR